MAKSVKLSFKKNELNKELSGFFKGMLENGAIEAVLVPMAQAKKGVRLTLITSAAHTARVDPFAPIAADKRCKNCLLAYIAAIRPQACAGPAAL